MIKLWRYKMNIIIFGAAGNVGSRLVKEALDKGHKVSGVVRRKEQLSELPKAVKGLIGDAQNLQEITSLVKNHDLIISAVRPPSGDEMLLVGITETILAAAKAQSIRSIIVGGAASLQIPGKDETVLSEQGFLPAQVVPIATACFAQHQAVEQFDYPHWSYISPPAMLVPGKRTGQYKLGKDELLYDAQGSSHISMEDFCVAIIDEALLPQHHRQRFTVAYA
jgi:putative NADH-flavin reductase